MAEEKNGKVIAAGKTTCACGPGCTCGCGHYCMHRVIWWILGIVVLVIVFCIGVKVGQFQQELRSMFGGYGHGYPTMQYHMVYGGGNGSGVVSPAQPIAPSGNATGTPVTQ